MNRDSRSEGEGEHPPIAPAAALDASPAWQGQGVEAGGGKSSVSRRHWIEFASLLVLTFTLFAAGYTAYEGSLLSKATSNLVATNAATAHRELRAYVGVTPGGLENFGDDQNQRLAIIRRNYGRTPAYNVFIKQTLAGVMRYGDNIPYDDASASKLSGLLSLFPDISLPFYITGSDKISKDQADLIKEGKDLLYVYAGIVTYYDAFGEPHYTRYCWFFKGPSMTEKDVEWCPTHNDSN